MVKAVPPRMTRPSRHVLYLDFDGVLHPSDVRVNARRGIFVNSPAGRNLFEHADLLERLMAPYPEVVIVLSTSWVKARGFRYARNRLPKSLSERVVGATYHSRFMRDRFRELPRGAQVWADVVRRGPERWLALDDDAIDWPDWCLDRLVRTHETEGLSHPDVLAVAREAFATQFRDGRDDVPALGPHPL